MTISITLTHEPSAIDALREEWITLHERSCAGGAALSWHWISVWWKHFRHLGKLWLLLARDEHGTLIGIAPLMQVKEKPKYGPAWSRLGFIGAIHYHEHLDFIVEPGQEATIIPLFLKQIKEHDGWDELHLSALSETETLRVLQESGDEWHLNNDTEMVAPYVTLPAETEIWMSSLSRNRRWKLRRYWKQLDEEFPQNWSITQVTTVEQIDAVLPVLVELHQAKWIALGKPGAFGAEGKVAFFRELMERMLELGWLRLYHMVVGGKTATILFAYQYRGRTYNQIAGLDESMTEVPVGHVMTYHSIDQAIAEKSGEYSMMWGQEEYKYSFGAQDRVQQSYDLVRSTRVHLQQRAVDFLRDVKHRVKN